MQEDKSPVKISSSMMCADFLNLTDELAIIEKFGFDYLHIDIMDGHYVPNLTLGPGYCEKISRASLIPLDIHLMVEDVDLFIPMFTQFKGSMITFHPETSRHPLRSIDAIQDAGSRPGIAVDPAQPIDSLKHLLPAVDLVLLMMVNPGYSGQKLVPGSFEKIAEFVRYRENMGVNLEIEIDGNVSWENIPPMIEVGGDILVVGTSSVFGEKKDRERDATRLKRLISKKSDNHIQGDCK